MYVIGLDLLNCHANFHDDTISRSKIIVVSRQKRRQLAGRKALKSKVKYFASKISKQSIRPRTAASPSIQSVSHITLGLSPWRGVMCDTLCMLGEAAVRGLIDCIFKIPVCT